MAHSEDNEFLTPVQSRMARAALRWDLRSAAAVAGIGVNTLLRFEQSRTRANKSTLTCLMLAYENVGIVFIENGIILDEDGDLFDDVDVELSESVVAGSA